MKTKDIEKELTTLQDTKYRDMQIKIIPNIPPDSIIGVRTPELRKLAKQISKEKDTQEFLDELPHRYFDENQLHAFVISDIKDIEKCLERVDGFLPFVDNWATCDQMSPKIFKKHRPQLLGKIKEWIASGRTYTIRFGIGMMMEHFLDDDFDTVYVPSYY